MSHPKSPPPGSMPSSLGSPDVSSMMDQLAAAQGAGGVAGNAGLGSMSGGSMGTPQQPARPVGNPLQEAQYLAGDVTKGVAGVLPEIMQRVLGILPSDTPEEVARKKQIHQRYQQMSADQQAVVHKEMAEREKQKQQEQEQHARRQQELQKQQSNELPVPQGKTRGEGGPGASKKTNTMTNLQNQRKKLSSAG